MIYFYDVIYDGTELFKSTFDNKDYRVRDHDKQLKANLLSIINSKFNIITDSLKNDSKYKNDENVKRLLDNWNSGVTIKEIGRMENDAAYVINKKYISFCLKDFTNFDIANINLLTYVAIHEFSHIMSNELGHGEEFKNNFKFLLNYSKNLKYIDPELKKEIQLYIPLKELKTPDNYCGVSIINSIN